MEIVIHIYIEHIITSKKERYIDFRNIMKRLKYTGGHEQSSNVIKFLYVFCFSHLCDIMDHFESMYSTNSYKLSVHLHL
jgi:hypothetical protein